MTATNTSAKTVTSEQIDAAWRIIGDDGKVFYRVASANDFDTTYTVRSIKVNGKRYLTCTCKAGENGKECWHKRAAVAHAEEYKATEKALAERNAQAAKQQKLDRIRRLVERGLTHPQALLAAENHESISDDELVRIYGKPARKITGRGRTDTRVFSLMR